MTYQELKRESDKLRRIDAAALFIENTDMALVDIAAALSCNIATVRRAKQKLGLSIREYKPKLKADIVNQAKSEAELYRIGHRALNIAAGARL